MKSNESLEQFSNQFIQNFYEFLDDDVDWEYLDQKFWFLVRISRKYFQSNPSEVLSQEEPQPSEQEYTLPFIPCRSPFPVPCVVPIQVGKYENQIHESDSTTIPNVNASFDEELLFSLLFLKMMISPILSFIHLLILLINLSILKL